MYNHASLILHVPPRAVAISSSAEIQLKNGFWPRAEFSTLLSAPKPVDEPILAAPPLGRLNLSPRTAMASKSNVYIHVYTYVRAS